MTDIAAPAACVIPGVVTGERDRLVAALTLYGEARGEPSLGQVAVVWTIANRAAARQAGRPRWWGGPGLASVCLKASQYSCWNAGDPNATRLLAFLTVNPDPSDPLVAEIAGCRAIVDQVLAGEWPDPTRAATHYARLEVDRPWMHGAGVVETVRIGHHKFFAGVS